MEKIIVKFHTKPEHKEEFRAVLLENRKHSKEEEGFIGMDLFEDSNNPNIIFAMDTWESSEYVEAHTKSPHAIKMIKLAEKALVNPPEIIPLNDTTPSPIPAKEANSEDEVFVIFFIFKINEEYRERLLKQFETHVENSRKEEGCLLFDFYTINGVNDTLVVYEHWRSESAVWDIHMNQPYSKITGALMEEAVVGDMKQYMSFVTEIK